METIEEENDKEIKNCERESYYNINIEEEKIQNEENSNDDEKENKTNKELSEQPEDLRYTRTNSIFGELEKYADAVKENNDNENDKQNDINKNSDNNENNNDNLSNCNTMKIEEINSIQNADKNNNINQENNINNNKVENAKEYKIIILGDYGTGKSSIIWRYLNNDFKSELEAPYPENNLKKIQLGENTHIILNIWDTAGEERSSKLFKKYYVDAYGALLIFDLTNINSFKNIKKWEKEVKENAPRDIVLCFIGNKTDLSEERSVKLEDIKEYVKNDLYYEVSSKTGNNISLAFEQLACSIIEKQIEEEKNPDKVLRGVEARKTTGLKDVPKIEEKKKKKKCC